jgi:glutamine---fructose-6-phosphate transaminase (isomerizing)
MPIAYEGAFKLKGISCILAEGYPASEMKHDSIAFIDEDLHVFCLATRDSWHEKLIQQAKAHDVIVLG